jgi:death-on-curing protein
MFMRFTNDAVTREYEWWCRQVGPEDPYVSNTTLGIHQVLRAHYLIVDYFVEAGEGLGGAGPRHLDLLHSALSRQFVGFAGRQKWTTLYEIAATLFFGLVKNHAFHDANKRTALLTVLFHLHSHGQTPEIAQKELDKLTVRVAENELSKIGLLDALKMKMMRRYGFSHGICDGTPAQLTNATT